MNAGIDHLVVLAADLAQGVAWCERTLGVKPGPGGQHPLMGTHNRLMRIATDECPRAYLEIIAIDPDAAPIERRRWFDMDDKTLADSLRRDGPRLAHWVVAVDDAALAAARWSYLGIERGPLLRAQRQTPSGMLSWQITVRDDGQRLYDGCLPTLIQWGEVHPTDHMPASGVTLEAVSITHPQAAMLDRAFHAIGLDGPPSQTGVANLCVQLRTPLGLVTLDSIHPSAGAESRS